MDAGAVDPFAQPVRDQKIVDAPAGILLPGLEHIAPPGVGAGLIGVQIPEGIGKAAFQQLGEAFTLLIREAGVTPVGGGILQIDLLVGNIQIAAEDHGLDLIQTAQVCSEGFLPFHPMINSCKLPLGIGGVAGDKIEFRVLQGDDPAFCIQFRHADAAGDIHGGVAGKDGGAGIALLFGVAPVLLIAGQLKLDLSFLQLRLLKAEKVRIQLGKAFQKAFLYTGTQAVNIPGYESHADSFLTVCYSDTSSGSKAGKVTVKTEPLPRVLSTWMVPLFLSTMVLTMDRPRPLPPVLRDRALSTR